MTSTNDFKSDLSKTILDSLPSLWNLIGEEELYALSLYTSGEDYFQYVCLSANTESGLAETASKYAKNYPSYSTTEGINSLRWSVPDWKYHDFSPSVSQLEIPESQSLKEDRKIYANFISAMKKAARTLAKDQRGKNCVFLITCGDMSERFMLRGLKKLNSPEVTNSFIQKYTAIPYLTKIRSLPEDDRINFALSLYQDLALNYSSPSALEARASNVSHFDIGSLLVEIGPKVIPHLIGLIEKFGFSKIFNEKGSPAFDKHGAFTLEKRLSTGVVFLIGEIGVPLKEESLSDLQKILKKRVEIDQNLQKTTTLAENIARVLHRLEPSRFPESEINRKSNHLDNPDPFLPR